MRKEIKKNNKMLLALVVVAALAMVSIAGVALSEKSDAANRIDQMNFGMTILTSDDSNLNAQFFILPGQITDGGMQYVKIAPGVTISGKIAVGTASNVNGADYKEYASITLDGVSNAIFNLLMAPDGSGGLMGIIMVGDGANVNLAATTVEGMVTDYAETTGTITLTKGALVAGAIRPMSEPVIKSLEPLWKDALLSSTATDNIGGNIGSRVFNMVNKASPIYGASLVANMAAFGVPDWTPVFPTDLIPGGIAPFTGTVIIGDSELWASYLYGARLGLVDGKAVIYGETMSYDAFLPWTHVLIPIDDATGLETTEGYWVGTPKIYDPIDTDYAWVPEFNFDKKCIEFVSGDWSVAFPPGFASSDGNYFRLVNVNGVVGEDAKVIVGDNMPTIATQVVVSINKMTGPGGIGGVVQVDDTSANNYLWIIPETGAAIRSTLGVLFTTPTGVETVQFTFTGVALNTPYSIFGNLDDGANVTGFYSTMIVSGTGANYTANIGANRVFGSTNDNTVAAEAPGFQALGPNDVKYNYVGMGTLMGAWSTLTGALEFTANDAKTGLIKGAIAANQAGATLFMVFRQGGQNTLYMTPAVIVPTVAPDSTTNGVTGAAPALTARFSNISVVPADAVTKFELSTQLYMDPMAGAFFAPDGYTFVVKGYMDFIFTNNMAPQIKGIFVQPTDYNWLIGLDLDGTNGTVYNITFEGTGTIAYGTIPQEMPSLIFHPMSEVGNLNAAFYYKNEGPTATPDKTTFYYTTLDNALKNSNEVTIVGWIYILEDTVLQGPDTTKPTKINISADSGLQIGLKAWNVDGATVIGWKGAMPPIGGVVIPAQSYAPKVELPTGTTVEKTTGSSQYLVQYGQAIYDVKPLLDMNTPLAEVLIVGDKYIYTDLWTALNITNSGDVINLLEYPRFYPTAVDPYSGAILDQSGTLKAGVTLKDNTNANLWIVKGVVLTAAGKIDSTKTMTIEGTILVTGDSKFSAGAIATLIGTITIAQGGLLTVDGNTTRINGGANSVINVDGTLTLKGSRVVAYIIQITGTVNAASVLEATFAFVIGKAPEFISEPYTNTATLNGVASAYKVDDIAIVFGSKEFTQFAALKKTDYVVPTVGNFKPLLAADFAYATVYCAAGVLVPPAGTLPLMMVKPLSYVSALKDAFIWAWNTERDMSGSWLDNRVTVAGDTGWETVYAEWEWKLIDITLANYAGVNWTAYSTPVGWSNTTSGVSGTTNGSGTFSLPYNMVIVVGAAPNAGFTDTTVSIKLNGNAFTNGGTFKVTQEALFTAEAIPTGGGGGGGGGGDNGSSWGDPIVILLIVIIIIIAIIAIVVAAKLLRS